MEESAENLVRSFKRELFNLAVTDWVSVQEAWAMGDATFVHVAPDRRLQLVQRSIRDLVGEGLLAVYRGRWESTERERVTLEESDRLLSAWETWVPEETPTVFIAGDEPGDPFTWRATLDSM